MDEIAAETASWITKRYGPIAFDDSGDRVVASVPLYGGAKSEGEGSTKSEAIAALYKDLTPGLDAKEIG